MCAEYIPLCGPGARSVAGAVAARVLEPADAAERVVHVKITVAFAWPSAVAASHDVEESVAVDVDHGGMGRSGHVDREWAFGPFAAGILAVGQQAVREGIAGEDFGSGVVVEIDHLDVADPGRDLDVWPEGQSLKWESGGRVARATIEGGWK